jgi:IS5 family transposase
MLKYKTASARGLFDEEVRLEKLAEQSDPLVKLRENIDFEIFRPLLEEAFYKEDRGRGGARPYDYVMMFKILILQRYYSIGDDKTEFAILDRLSFMRFLGLSLSDRLPDAKTIWLFREKLTQKGLTEKLFQRFNQALQSAGLMVNEGKIIDASIVEVPVQRNTREENKAIKEGEIPEHWQDDEKKLSQKDTDARWTKKNGRSFYGYKNHVKADQKSKLIETYAVTAASVHDSQEVENLLNQEDRGQTLHADKAYSGEPVARIAAAYQMENHIHQKGRQDKPLTEEQKADNRAKSKVRARVEHIFGFIENSMNGSYIRSIGLARAATAIGLINLTYNMFRYMQLASTTSGRA